MTVENFSEFKKDDNSSHFGKSIFFGENFIRPTINLFLTVCVNKKEG